VQSRAEREKVNSIGVFTMGSSISYLSGQVYTFTTAKLQPLVTKGEGKGLIQACLNADDCETPIPSQKVSVILISKSLDILL